MKTTLQLALDTAVDQAVFASVIGVSEARVSQLVAEGVLRKGEPARVWLLAYCERLREQAAGRGQELTIERAALARSQRIGQEIKNAVAQREYAPIALLADVLAEASASVAAKFDSLSGQLQRRFPQLGEDDRSQLMALIAEARNNWVEEAASLTARKVDELAEDPADDAVPVDLPDDEGLPP